MIYRTKKRRLKKLRLKDGASDLNERFSRKYDRTLGDSPYITSELKVTKIGDELVVKTVIAQELEVFFRKVQIIKIIYDLLKSCHDGESAMFGNVPEEHVKIHDLVFVTSVKVTFAHSKLIEISEHTHVRAVIPHTVHDLSPRVSE